MSDAVSAAPKARDFYFTVWRWHFYAGLYVVPFLLMLAVTGLFMLWFTAIAPGYGEKESITPGAAILPITQQADAALALYPGGKIGQYIAPYTAENPAVVRIDLEGGNRMVSVNPYDATVLQDVPQDGTWNEWLTALHGELLWGGNGGPGDLLIETAASLGIIMVATGLYLWWPRGEKRWAAALVPAFRARGRLWWKSLHETVGAWISILLIVFLVSGLAWAGVWGSKVVQAWSTFPAEKWDNVPLSDKTHASLNGNLREQVPWALEQTLMPASGSDAGIPGLPEGTPVNLDSVYLLGRALGLEGRFQINAPGDDTGVWTISQDSMSYDGNSPFQDRTVHIDQYTGKILADVGFEDYAAGGKAMAVSIAFHEGMMGTWNLALNIAFCLSIIFLTVSGTVMWWLRRPAKAARIGAPPQPAKMPVWKGALVVLVILGAAFPVGGAVILAILALDWLVIRRIKPLARLVS
jgi:uncharacterized iron-regulated membrane protein